MRAGSRKNSTGGGPSRGPSVGFVDNGPPLFAEPEEPGEADEFEEPAPSRSGTGRSGSGHLSGSGRSGSGPAAARPMVRRRSLVSGVVKAKRANEEAEIEGLTEEQLIKAGKSFASYLLFLVIFSVTAAPRLPPPASRLPPAACRLPPPNRSPGVRAKMRRVPRVRTPPRPRPGRWSSSRRARRTTSGRTPP